MSTNLVLRFRDLSHETIQTHRSQIDKFGYVWWGWWKRPEEKIPRSELLRFQNLVDRNNHIWIFLADSGTFRLFKAKLIEIDFTHGEEPKACKELEKVPKYYSDSKYNVWFCFQSILDTNSNEIMNWEYDDPEELLLGDSSDELQWQRISSLHEMLKTRHRTMYFIRPYVKNGEHDNSDNLCKEIEKCAHQIMSLIEQIREQCDPFSRKINAPILMPRFPKKMEQKLKSPARDEIGISEFSSNLYKLIIDGHNPVFEEIKNKNRNNNNNTIVKYNEFSKIGNSICKQIRIFRCFHHHEDIRPEEKYELVKLYFEICGKNVLDDENSRLKFQLEMMKRTIRLLEKESDLVQKKIGNIELSVNA